MNNFAHYAVLSKNTYVVYYKRYDESLPLRLLSGQEEMQMHAFRDPAVHAEDIKAPS